MHNSTTPGPHHLGSNHLGAEGHSGAQRPEDSGTARMQEAPWIHRVPPQDIGGPRAPPMSYRRLQGFRLLPLGAITGLLSGIRFVFCRVWAPSISPTRPKSMSFFSNRCSTA